MLPPVSPHAFCVWSPVRWVVAGAACLYSEPKGQVKALMTDRFAAHGRTSISSFGLDGSNPHLMHFLFDIRRDRWWGLFCGVFVGIVCRIFVAFAGAWLCLTRRAGKG
jgi:hypothetical protein